MTDHETDRTKKRAALLLGGAFMLIPVLAIAAEIAAKYAYTIFAWGGSASFSRSVWQALARQLQAMWLLPTLWRIVPANVMRSDLHPYLRWLPNLFLILMPAAYWFLEARRERTWHRALLCIPIILSIYQAIGCMVCAGDAHLSYNVCVFSALPFWLEACLLVWLGVALRKKNRVMLKALGISFMVFCALSLFVSALMAELPGRLYMVNRAAESGSALNWNWGKWLSELFSAPYIFAYAGVSVWPLYKVFTMLMYALTAFFPPRQLAAQHSGRSEGMEKGVVHMNSRSKVVAALLAFFLGGVGAHRYYLGYKKQGAIQTCGFVSLIVGWVLYIPAMLGENVAGLLFSAVLLLYGAAIGIWAFVDFIRILTGGLMPEDGSDYSENRPPQVQVVVQNPSAATGGATAENASVNSESHSAAVDNIDMIERLARLHEQGILSDEEFQKKKTELLERV